MTPPLICDKHSVPVKEYLKEKTVPAWEYSKEYWYGCPKCRETWEKKLFKVTYQMAKLIEKQTLEFWSQKNGHSVDVYKAAKISTKLMLGKALKFKPIPIKVKWLLQT